jgi:WD40 repeat protein
MSMEPPVLFPVPIGTYRDTKFDKLEVDAEVERLARILAPFRIAGPVPWDVAMADRGADAVEDRLGAWASADGTQHTILYWAGHGWSNGHRSTLAHAFSPYEVGWRGVSPDDVAAAVAAWAGHPGRSRAWLIVVIDACKSLTFAEDVGSLLTRMRPGRVLVIGVSGDGRTRLGEFTRALEIALRTPVGGQDEVALTTLGHELRDALIGSEMFPIGLSSRDVLRRDKQFLRVTLEVRDELRRVLDDLTEDERRHFLPKAQSAETGELMWFFQGRSEETATIVGWLATHGQGLLVVTGDPGCGKSALLGQVLTYSQPELRELLIGRGLLTPIPSGHNPPDRVFTAAILLTGATVPDLVDRLAATFHLTAPPGSAGPAGDGDARVDWLLQAMSARGRVAATPVTLLFDGLDEAAEPITIARRLLVPLSALPQTRVVVGTRRSTGDGPDLPPPRDRNILDVLLPAGAEPLEIAYDGPAVGAYVRKRLTAAGTITDDLIGDIVEMIEGRSREFLYARLAVHEILATPSLLTARREADLAELLGHNYQQLFNAAVERLVEASPVNRPLLLALSVAKGRGLPASGRTWTTIANALARPDERATVADADALLQLAAPHIIIDVESGQTVYRLAHRTFAELLAPLVTQPDRLAVVRALLAGDRLPSAESNPYLVRHLADYAADDGTAWQLLADRPDVLDRLDPGGIAAHALSPRLGEQPPAIAGTAVMRDHMTGAGPGDRAGLRQIGTVQVGHAAGPSTPDAAWSLRWSALNRRVLQGTIGRHSGAVRGVAVVTRSDGSPAIASADRTVRLWDPSSTQPIDGPWNAHAGPAIWALAAVHRPGTPASLLVCGAVDGSLFTLDLGTGERRVWLAAGEAVLSLAVGGDRSLAVGGDRSLGVGGDGEDRQWAVSRDKGRLVRAWDVASGAEIGTARRDRRTARGLATFAAPDGSIRIVSGDERGGITIWDPADPAHDRGWAAHDAPIFAVTALTGADGDLLIVSGDSEGVIRRWDPAGGTQVGADWEDPTGGAVQALTTITAGGRAMVVAAGGDHALRLWDPADGRMVGRPWTGHTDRVLALAGASRAGRGGLVVSAGGDGTVRLWDPALDATSAPDRIHDPHVGEVLAVAVLTRPGAPATVVTGGNDGELRRWAPDTSTQLSQWTAHPDAVLSLVALTGGRVMSVARGYTLRIWDGTTEAGVIHTNGTGQVLAAIEVTGSLIVTGGSDSTVRLWDPATGGQVGPAWTGHLGAVWALTAVTLPGGTAAVVSGSADGTLRLWRRDPDGAATSGDPWLGHTGWVRAVVAVAGPDAPTVLASGGADGHLRLWDTSGAQTAEPWNAGSGILAMTADRGPDGRLSIVLACEDTSVRRWDPLLRRETGLARIGYPIKAMAVLDGSVVLATDQGVLAVDLAS